MRDYSLPIRIIACLDAATEPLSQREVYRLLVRAPRWPVFHAAMKRLQKRGLIVEIETGRFVRPIFLERSACPSFARTTREPVSTTAKSQ